MLTLPTANRPVTQKQIAERLGVTQQLVALALKGSPLVAEKTRLKVNALAQEMGYSANANHHARALAAARHGTHLKNDVIAVVRESVPGLTMATTDPYFMRMLDGIESEVEAHSIDLFLVPNCTAGLPWLIREGWVDGVILLGARRILEEVASLAERGLPVITLGWSMENLSGIAPQNTEGIEAATTHLIQLGHSKIAYLGPDKEWSFSQERLQGFRRAMHRAGLEAKDEWIMQDLPSPFEPEGADGMARLLQIGGFTAVVCHNDPIAKGAIGAAVKEGLCVPQDISITGFDDISTVTGFTPTITSIGFSSVDMGRQSVRMLLEMVEARLKNQAAPETRFDYFPIELRVHESTAPSPANFPR